MTDGEAQKLKRFYKDVTTQVTDDGHYGVQLDGRGVRTPGRKLVRVSSSNVADALAQEWRAQEEFILPAMMPLSRLVNSAIDGVIDATAPVVDDLVQFAGTDLLYYRAESPQQLVARQMAAWDPILSRFEKEHGFQFVLAGGIMHVAQSQAMLDGARTLVKDLDGLVIAGLHSMTTLSGSVLLALSVWQGWLSTDKAWAAAHVDEDWNIHLWGEDEEARARRATRKREFEMAALLASG